MMITRLRKQIHAAKADLTPAFLRSLRGLQTPGANSPKLDILLYSTFWVARKSGCPGANYLQEIAFCRELPCLQLVARATAASLIFRTGWLRLDAHRTTFCVGLH